MNGKQVATKDDINELSDRIEILEYLVCDLYAELGKDIYPKLYDKISKYPTHAIREGLYDMASHISNIIVSNAKNHKKRQ